MTVEVRAELLKIGDLVELPTISGPEIIRVTVIKPRVSGIKFEGPNRTGSIYSWGFEYGQPVKRLRRLSRVGRIVGAVLLIVLQAPLAFLALVQTMPREGPHELDAASEFRDLSHAGILWGILVLLLTFPFVRARFLRPRWYAVTLLSITVLAVRQFLFPPYT